MAYVRGNAADYDSWAAEGNPGWAYKEILTYFKKSEHNPDYHDHYHGKDGPLHVEYAKRFRTPFQDAFIKACNENGIASTSDYNGASQRGVADFQFTIKAGKRQSTATAFLKPALNRKNLSILTHTQVNKIIIEKNEAKGVQATLKNGQTQDFLAAKAVILTAGSFSSPQLLMQSGIGDSSDLKARGIKPIHHLSGVGKNLQDHLFYGVSALSTIQAGQNHHLKPLNQLKALTQYLISKKGILTVGPLESVAFGHSGLDPSLDVDFQFHFASLQIGDNYEVDMYNPDTFPRTDGFSILPTLLKPKSRGEVRLSADFKNYGLDIDPHFCTHEYDKQLLIQTGQQAFEILKAQAFSPYFSRHTLPQSSDPDSLWEHIKNQVETVYHPVGTCRMGQDTDAVVDPKLWVHGLGKLMVADASIMPSIVAGNTNAPVIMIAEKAADLLHSF
jgi:choline dehydrogenase